MRSPARRAAGCPQLTGRTTMCGRYWLGGAVTPLLFVHLLIVLVHAEDF